MKDRQPSPADKANGTDEANSSPMQHPDEQPISGSSGTPKFGRLLLVLILVVVLVGLITFASEALYS